MKLIKIDFNSIESMLIRIKDQIYPYKIEALKSPGMPIYLEVLVKDYEVMTDG